MLYVNLSLITIITVYSLSQMFGYCKGANICLTPFE